MESDILPVEFTLLPNSKVVCLKKGIISPIEIERPLALKVYSVLCSIFIISHFLRFVNILSKILSKYLPKGKKPPLCKGSLIASSSNNHCLRNQNKKHGMPLSR